MRNPIIGTAMMPKTTEQIMIASVELMLLPSDTIKKTIAFIIAAPKEHITPAKNSTKKR
jgi:hypothetical protein